MNSKKYLILLTLTILLIFFFQNGVTFVPVEDISINSSLGIDLLEGKKGEPKYNVSFAVYNFGTAPEIKTIVLEGKGDTIGETLRTKQLKLDKKFLEGTEKIFILNDKIAKLGISPFIDIVFQSTETNDNAYIIVTDDKPQELMNFKIDNIPNSSDYIEGMIKHSTEQNFLSKKYYLRNAYNDITAEGNNLVVPYIEIKGKILAITGMALFRDDKMVRKIGIEESKAMNLLREDNVKGNISIKKSLDEYIDIFANSKRKVKVQRKGEKYIFNIDVNIEGYIITNLIYKDIIAHPEVLKKIEKEAEKELRKMTEDFTRKMQNEYKVDCLNLGEYAAAKYGRDKDIDWNEIVCNSEIKINPRVKISFKSRGLLK